VESGSSNPETTLQGTEHADGRNTGGAIPGRENAKAGEHKTRLRSVLAETHSSEMEGCADYRATGASCGAVASHTGAGTQEQSSRAGLASHLVGLRDVARRRAYATKSNGAGAGNRCVQAIEQTTNYDDCGVSRLSAILTEPYRTMATIGVCLGLRWSEIVGLQWKDINWIDGELRLQRAVVKQIEDEVKTVHSSKPLALDARILDLFKQHRQNSVFTAPDDWVFASPVEYGKLPRSYTSFWEKLGRACHDAGIVHVSPHSFRHSYRAWLDELGTPVTVQQRAMRHGDIRVTMSYGDAVGEGLREATSKLAARAIPQ
jgi:integrase